MSMIKNHHRFRLWEAGMVFKVLYLLLGLLSFNSLVANRGFLSGYSMVLAVMGGIYFVYRLLHYGAYIRAKGLALLALFLVSYAAASLANLRYGISENIQSMIWMVMQFFLLYAYDTRLSRKQIRRECSVLGGIVVAYTFLCALAGLVCLVLNYSQVIKLNGATVITGYTWHRLWGFYSDPNYGAVLSAISLMIGLFFAFGAKKPGAWCFAIVNALVQLAYITFSDSRTGLICLLVSVFWMSAVLLIRVNPIAKIRRIPRAPLAIAMAVVITVLTFGATRAILWGGNQYLSAVTDPESPLFFWMVEDKQEGYEEEILEHPNEKVEIEDITVGRGEDSELGEDISNRRFAIWKSALEIVATRPILGVSFRHILPYAREFLPQTYIVNNDYNDFASMHNLYIDVIVSQGIVGILIFLSFVIFVVVSVLRRIFKDKGEGYFLPAMVLCIVVPIVVSAFFYSEILFINTGGSVIFWCAMGYLMNLLDKAPEPTEDRVGILTFHNARRHGSNLQALALQRKLTAMGIDNTLIDYEPKYIEDRFGLVVAELWNQSEPTVKGRLGFFRATGAQLLPRAIREARFRLFGDRYYRLTTRVYYDKTSLAQGMAREKCPTVLFGGDRIWDSRICRGLDGTFFGIDFPENTRKAAYAPVIGTDVPREQQAQMAQFLSSLDHISVREASAEKLLQSMVSTPVEVVCDPTVLLEKEAWEKLCKPINVRGDYICVYARETNEALNAFTARLAKQTGLPIVHFGLKNRFGCKAYCRFTADPLEFIGYIKNARYVVTDSYHCTVFSVLFEKQFLCFPDSTGHCHCTQLLKQLRLQHCLADGQAQPEALFAPTDFTEAHATLAVQRASAEEYLKKVAKL